MTEIELETRRLLLRPVEPTDSEAVFNYRSDAEINKYQGWIPKSEEDVQNFINHRVCPQIDMAGTWFQLVIIQKDASSVIGDIGIHFDAEDHSLAELGITLDWRHQGKGYAREALTVIIDYLFQKLHKQKLVASIDPRNASSIRLFERLGFEKEALYEKSLFLNGEWVDDLVMGLQR